MISLNHNVLCSIFLLVSELEVGSVHLRAMYDTHHLDVTKDVSGTKESPTDLHLQLHHCTVRLSP